MIGIHPNQLKLLKLKGWPSHGIEADLVYEILLTEEGQPDVLHQAGQGGGPLLRLVLQNTTVQYSE